MKCWDSQVKQHCKRKNKKPKTKQSCIFLETDDISSWPEQESKTAIWGHHPWGGCTSRTFSQLGLQTAVIKGLLRHCLKSGCWLAQFGDECAVTFLCYFYFSSFNDCILKWSQTTLLLNTETVYCVWWVFSFVNESFKLKTRSKTFSKGTQCLVWRGIKWL